MPRFVILWHESPAGHRQPHWDLMLEDGQVLRTWAMDEAPSVGRPIQAEQLPDHRLMYLDYQGPISGQRGRVTQWDHGDFEWVTRDLQRLVIVMRGQRLQARLSLSFEPRTQRWLIEPSAVDSATRG
jgi:hypothetical protein